MATSDNLSPDRKKKIAIKFVIILFVVYLVFNQGNLFMNSLLSPGGNYYSPFLDKYFDYIHVLRMALIKPAVLIIKTFGLYAIHNDNDVMVVNGPYLRVNYSCLGLGVMSFLAAFLIAFPAKLKPKIQMLFIGIITIYLLNVLRIAGLGIILGKFNSQKYLFNYHHELFNIIVYLIVLFVLYKWIKRNSDANEIQ